jgi:hypothetical protein
MRGGLYGNAGKSEVSEVTEKELELGDQRPDWQPSAGSVASKVHPLKLMDDELGAP